MPPFAVFFADGAGFGIEMVQALDAAHAQHPTGRLSAVPAELLDGQSRHKVLADDGGRTFPSEIASGSGSPLLIALIEPHYPKASKKGGRPPYPLAT